MSACLPCRLDVGNSGYIELAEWGSSDPVCLKMIEKLTVAYMRRHMGFPSQVSSAEKVEHYSRTHRAKEVTSIQQALALARDYCFRKAAGTATDGISPMMLAFQFMDVDRSGQLSKCAPHYLLQQVHSSLRCTAADSSHCLQERAHGWLCSRGGQPAPIADGPTLGYL